MRFVVIGLPVAAIALAVIAVSAFGASSAARSLRTNPGPSLAEHVEPARLPLLDIPEAEWTAIERHFRPVFFPDRAGVEYCRPSACSHALRLRGRNTQFDEPRIPTSADLLRTLTDQKSGRVAFGADLIVRSRHGVRFRPSADLQEMRTAADESHQDQSLAALLEAGLPLSHPLILDDLSLTLRDAVVDAVACFDLEAPELEWTAIALTLSVPPDRSWTNRFGEVTSFDDLAAKLLELPPDKRACAGTHVFYALVLIVRVHEAMPILTAQAHHRVLARLKEWTERAVSTQRSDGSWDAHWFAGSAERASHKVRYATRDLGMATGHLGECLLRLPVSMRPADDCLRRAGQWLWHWLQQGVKEPNVFRREFCPYTHAACCVRDLRRTS